MDKQEHLGRRRTPRRSRRWSSRRSPSCSPRWARPPRAARLALASAVLAIIAVVAVVAVVGGCTSGIFEPADSSDFFWDYGRDMVELAKQHGACVEDSDCALLSDGIALQCPSLNVSYGMCYLPVASAQVQAFHDDAQELQAHYCDLARDKGIRGVGGGPMCPGEVQGVCREGVCDVGDAVRPR